MTAWWHACYQHKHYKLSRVSVSTPFDVGYMASHSCWNRGNRNCLICRRRTRKSIDQYPLLTRWSSLGNGTVLGLDRDNDARAGNRVCTTQWSLPNWISLIHFMMMLFQLSSKQMVLECHRINATKTCISSATRGAMRIHSLVGIHCHFELND